MRTAVVLLLGLALPHDLAAQVIGGRVLDSASRRPVVGVTVRAYPESAHKSAVKATTDTSGVFYLDVPRSGKYLVQVGILLNAMVPEDTILVAADDFIQKEYLFALPLNPVFVQFQAEKPVAPRSLGPGPRYPYSLRELHVEGHVLVQYVVDTTGYAEPKSIQILRATHREFAESVIAFVLNVSFVPAEIDGHRVRQLVQQPFNFSLR